MLLLGVLSRGSHIRGLDGWGGLIEAQTAATTQKKVNQN